MKIKFLQTTKCTNLIRDIYKIPIALSTRFAAPTILRRLFKHLLAVYQLRHQSFSDIDPRIIIRTTVKHLMSLFYTVIAMSHNSNVALIQHSHGNSSLCIRIVSKELMQQRYCLLVNTEHKIHMNMI